MIELPGGVIARYGRFSLYNSPYPAHRRGRAIDLYPDDGIAASPVSGTVSGIRRVECPDRPYAADEDCLILVDCGRHVARMLHVDPDVEVGDSIAVGDRLGTLIRSGFFAPWVDGHIHLGFRRPEQNLERASGSLPLSLDIDVTGVPWDGTGTVVETGETYAVLDAPSNDAEGFAAVASDGGVPLDGGLVHYAGGGALGGADGAVSLLGTEIGTAEGRDVTWAPVAVVVDGERASGLSLFASRGDLGVKIVFADGHGFSVGEDVAVSIEGAADPIRFG